MDGVELGILNQGVFGAYPQSEDPGQIGNFAVAGHRTTYGRPMWNVTELSQGDPIVVETKDDYFIYRFDRTQIVTPHQTEVIADVPGDPAAIATEAWMVMTGCHPKFSAAERIVALAARSLPASLRLAAHPRLRGGGHLFLVGLSTDRALRSVQRQHHRIGPTYDRCHAQVVTSGDGLSRRHRTILEL